ncbi:Integrase-like protein [Gossypium australe]|uniref:Integrase-like protein n=1 Tax=Gossypium australe TaxID=47621 RepID=A0A5B6W7Z6_9ROSI|nr:Integrase-like protein [Gossypium australe]
MAIIQMIQNTLKFKGNMAEDPNQHLKRFLQLCNTFKYNEVFNDAVHLRRTIQLRREITNFKQFEDMRAFQDNDKEVPTSRTASMAPNSNIL